MLACCLSGKALGSVVLNTVECSGPLILALHSYVYSPKYSHNFPPHRSFLHFGLMKASTTWVQRAKTLSNN